MRPRLASGPPPTTPPLGLRRRAPIKNDPGEIYFVRAQRPNRYKADVNGGDNAAGGTFIHAGAAAEALVFALS